MGLRESTSEYPVMPTPNVVRRARYQESRGIFHRRHRLPHLQEIREMRGHSRQGLSRLSGVGHGTIKRAEEESGCAQAKTVLRLAAALRCRPENLTGELPAE